MYVACNGDACKKLTNSGGLVDALFESREVRHLRNSCQ